MYGIQIPSAAICLDISSFGEASRLFVHLLKFFTKLCYQLYLRTYSDHLNYGPTKLFLVLIIWLLDKIVRQSDHHHQIARTNSLVHRSWSDYQSRDPGLRLVCLVHAWILTDKNNRRIELKEWTWTCMITKLVR